jgi:Tol biopolymer transport system component/predicted Ser/Thr protein kinase
MSPERLNRIEELFHSARDREPLERAAFLADACLGDPELQAEVESLLTVQAESLFDGLDWAQDPGSRIGPTPTSGSEIGPYRIVGTLGSGGMGVVYRAHDSRLGREVAIKFLGEHVARDPQSRTRFEREARAVAALSHPNICTLFDVGPNYLVMELLEGQTLKERIATGRFSNQELYSVAIPVSEALNAAHSRGIMHRDIKPGNIFITSQGIVKILDFGLAKTVGLPDCDPSDKKSLTKTGLTLGTLSYMSPEQTRGKEVDARTDLFSFGVVLYEMATGSLPFTGNSWADICDALLNKDPHPASELNPEITPELGRIIERALEKDRALRYQTAADLHADLLRVQRRSESGIAPASSSEGKVRVAAPAPRRVLPWAAAAAILSVIAGAALWGLWRYTRPVLQPLVQVEMDLGPTVTLPSTQNLIGHELLSPDGTRLVYFSGNPTKLYTRRLDQANADELPGTEPAGNPFFSPDGRWVGFFNDGGRRLNKVSVEGGFVVSLAEVPSGYGASWGTDGSIIIGGGFTHGLLRVPENGGAPRTVLDLGPGDILYRTPQILPGGKAVLFLDYREPSGTPGDIEVFSFADRRRKTLLRGTNFARYLTSGHLVYTHESTLFAIPFDVNRLETRGTAVPVLNDLDAGNDLDFAGNGTLVYRRRSGGGDKTQLGILQWVDRAGKRGTMLAKPDAYRSPFFSPDGKRLTFVLTQPTSQDVWVYDTERDATTRLTFGGGTYDVPFWTRDGNYIVLAAAGKGLYWTRSDGAALPQPLIQSTHWLYASSFTSDGKRLAYVDTFRNGRIWTVPVEDQGGQLKAGNPELFLKDQFSDVYPDFSPDGHWLAYSSNESGRDEVYVRPFPLPATGPGAKWQISNGGGNAPWWLSNGREIGYVANGQIMMVNYSLDGGSFVPERPRVVFDKLGGEDWCAFPDGKRIAVITPLKTPDTPANDHELTLLFNFFDELRRRVPQ